MNVPFKLYNYSLPPNLKKKTKKKHLPLIFQNVNKKKKSLKAEIEVNLSKNFFLKGNCKTKAYTGQWYIYIYMENY